jgi:hypothetical protein
MVAGMPPSDSNTNVTVDQLEGYVGGGGGTTSPADLCDWSKGHLLYTGVDWPVLLLNDAVIIAGVGLIVWIMLRKQK